ncbi:MAG: condensation domain-containing protein, partial [Bradymonadaceae bacterium]
HIAIDEWTTGLVVEELEELYEARCERRDAALEEPRLQYADYAIWQRERLESEAFDEGLEWWKQQLDGAPEGIDWPMGGEPTEEEHPAETVEVSWGMETSRAIRRVADDRGTSVFVVLYALFSGFLGRYTGQRDVTIGLPVTLRDRPELQGVLGFLLNTLPMRSELELAVSFEEWLSEANAAWREARAYQWIPLEEIVRAVGANRRPGALPLFDVMFNYLPGATREGDFGELTYEPFDCGGVPEAKCALDGHFTEENGDIVGEIEYDAARFDRADVERLVEHLERFVERCLDEPGHPMANHELLGDEGRRTVMTEWGRGAVADNPFDSVHRMFEQRVREHPERMAVHGREGEWTYRELNRRA